MPTAIDKLYNEVSKKGHVCVGLDTSADYIPQGERNKAGNDAEAVLAYNKALIDSTFEAAACFKVQIAYYEEMGIQGLKAYSQSLKYIRQKGGISIADIKRGDIAETALRYAKGHFSGDFEADFVTLSPYMGMDAITPWLDIAKQNNKGAFVLMRTSNMGMRDFQQLTVSSEKGKREKGKGNSEQLTVSNSQCTINSEKGKREKGEGNKLYRVVGDKLAELAQENLGDCGYGIFGAVVGCTERDEAAEIRGAYPNLFFLIPGYGAQGGAAEDAALLLRNGNGGVVNASRSIITAWQKEEAFHENGNKSATLLFAADCALGAALKMRDEILKELRS